MGCQIKTPFIKEELLEEVWLRTGGKREEG